MNYIDYIFMEVSNLNGSLIWTILYIILQHFDSVYTVYILIYSTRLHSTLSHFTSELYIEEEVDFELSRIVLDDIIQLFYQLSFGRSADIPVHFTKWGDLDELECWVIWTLNTLQSYHFFLSLIQWSDLLIVLTGVQLISISVIHSDSK